MAPLLFLKNCSFSFCLFLLGNFQKLGALDARVLARIVQCVGPLGDDTQRIAMALFCNCVLELSPDRKQVLFFVVFVIWFVCAHACQASLAPERFAGARWPLLEVIALYVGARSAETMSNAFLLLFQHVMGKLRDAAPPASLPRFNEQAATLLAVLAAMGAPTLFQKVGSSLCFALCFVTKSSVQVFLHPLTQEEVRSLSGVISAVKSQAKSKTAATLRQTKAKRQNNKLLAQLDIQVGNAPVLFLFVLLNFFWFLSLCRTFSGLCSRREQTIWGWTPSWRLTRS